MFDALKALISPLRLTYFLYICQQSADSRFHRFLVVQFISFTNQILLFNLPITWRVFSYANNFAFHWADVEPAAGGDEAAPPRPDVHCWESTADAKPGFDKHTDTKTTLGRWQFVQSNRHGETLTWLLLRLFKAEVVCFKKRKILISHVS